jgi:hypothetical protein
MVRILQSTFDSSGALVRSAHLPVVFQERAEAETFLRGWLQQMFTEGRSGYKQEEDYWWGCDDAPRSELHRYTIEEA